MRVVGVVCVGGGGGRRGLSAERSTGRAADMQNTAAGAPSAPDTEADGAAEARHAQEDRVAQVGLTPHAVQLPVGGHEEEDEGQGEEVVVEDLRCLNRGRQGRRVCARACVWQAKRSRARCRQAGCREHRQAKRQQQAVPRTMENSPSFLPSLVCCATLSIAPRM